ncbi:PLD nuclease N-terminal domain-containing protein [Peribacillus huizhouensis]|uniref:Glucose uptake protein GlcU n=1 Tax=Peribacillus huizhouensis TaxID=1501239 RepID=A0ABR6CLU6_9BACI|nr:PLD nuclease N-terminal domain-containing protein [Peribacillus huizhouensis]MBA9025332.1 glucose uptake protein GlcU [Peribacillus huizhouensis]
MEYIQLLFPIIIFELILKGISIRDLLKRERGEVKGKNKLVWVLVILLISTIGPIFYLLYGRKTD